MKSLVVTIFILLAPLTLAFDHTHSQWKNVLQKHVQVEGYQSYVNYRAIKDSPRDLRDYLKSLSSVSKTQFENFSEDQRLSFLINSYNAFTIELIIRNYPLDSIKDIGSFFKSPWKKRFFTLLGEKRHLDDIEHVLIRKNFNEPRIHFAVVCASIGCPPLATIPFTEDNIENLLQKSAENFLADKNKNYVKLEKNKLYISKIFKWYGDDFSKKHGSLINALKLYIKEPIVLEALDRDEFKIKYTKYDWKLNEYRSL